MYYCVQSKKQNYKPCVDHVVHKREWIGSDCDSYYHDVSGAARLKVVATRVLANVFLSASDHSVFDGLETSSDSTGPSQSFVVDNPQTRYKVVLEMCRAIDVNLTSTV